MAKKKKKIVHSHRGIGVIFMFKLGFTGTINDIDLVFNHSLKSKYFMITVWVVHGSFIRVAIHNSNRGSISVMVSIHRGRYS